MSQPVEGGASPESMQVGEIEDQMRNQERIIAQLHESIIAQDKQLLGREAEAQSYASKLKNLKTRHSRDQTGQEEAIPGTSVRVSTTKVVPPKTSGSLTLLRQKVEENRVKVAQRGRQELESKRELEEKVQALKSQLEEMQKVPASPTAPEQNPVDTQMIALQEQIQAKDSLIEARTRAITLLSEDFSRKRKEVVDQLEETREEMRHMQKNFITCEDHYKAEIQARDNRLFELDSKVRALSIKLEQTEELASVLAENENLQRQVEELNGIRDEKQCLEDKLKELLSVLDAHQQKEVEMSVLLQEKQKLYQYKVEELANVSDVNRENEEELSLLLKEKRRLQHQVKELANLSDLIRLKDEEFSLLLEEKQRLQHKVEELDNLSDVNRKKDKEFASLLEENQRLQHKVEELANLSDANQQKEKELVLLLEKKQRLQHQELANLSDANQQKEEELSLLLEEKQRLQRKVEELANLSDVNRQKEEELSLLLEENQRLQYKVEELANLSDVNRQKEEELSLLLEENQGLQHKVEELGNLSDVNRQKEEESNVNRQKEGEELSLLLEEKQRLQDKVEELANLSDVNRQKEEELFVLLGEKQRLQHNVEELANLSDVNWQKEEELSVLLEENQRLQHKVEELANLSDVNRQKEEELSVLLEENQRLQHKVEELANLSDVNRQKEEELSIHLKKNQSLQKRVDKLSRLLAGNDKKVKEMNVVLNTCRQHEEALSTLAKEKQSLEDKVEELSRLLDANQQKERAVSLKKNIILVGANSQQADEMATLLKEKQSLQKKLESLTSFLGNLRQDKDLSSQLHADKLDELVDLVRLLYVNDQKLGDLHCFLDTNEQNELESVLIDEKLQLEQKFEQCSAVLAVYRETIKMICTQRQESDNFQTQLLEDQTFGENINKTEMEELSLLIDVSRQNKTQQELLARALDASELRVKEQSQLLTTSQLKEEELLKDVCNYETKCRELTITVEPLQDKVDELSKLLDTNQHQHKEELIIVVQEKQLLQDKLQELSNLIEANDLNIQAMNKYLNTRQQEHNQELTTLFQEKQILQDKVQGWSNLFDGNQQGMQRIQDGFDSMLQQHKKNTSVLLNEKQLLQNEVNKLSGVIAANNKDLQRMDDALKASQEQHNANLSALLEKTQLLQDEVRDSSVLLKEKELLQDRVQQMSSRIEANEEHLQRMNDDLRTSEERHHEALSESNEEKQVLQDKVEQLEKKVAQQDLTVKAADYAIEVMSVKVHESEKVFDAALNEEIKCLKDQVNKLSGTIKNKELSLNAMRRNLAESAETSRNLSLLLQLGNIELANQKNDIEKLTQAKQHLMSEWSSSMKEKQDQVAELSDLLNTSQKEKTEEIDHILQEKNSLESEVKRLFKLIEEGKEKQKLALSKAHKKITDLKRHVNSLEKADDSSAIMVDLQNRIAELEEEKGNLQLHLVDFEELKALGSDLTAQVESLQGQKVTAEMKSVELEEELDNLKSQPEYREDQAALIDALQKYDLLNRSLIKCNSELSEEKIECQRLINLQCQLEKSISVLREDLAAKETEVLNWRERLGRTEASFKEVLKVNKHVVNTVEKFCFDIVNSRIPEMEGDYVSEVEQTMKVLNMEGMYSLELSEFNLKLGELLPAITNAQASLLGREALLDALKTELSEACDRTVNLETRLRQLEYCENETLCLKNEVDSLKGLLHEKQQEVTNQFPRLVSEEGNGSHGDSEFEARTPVEDTVRATRSHLQEHTPGNAVSSTQVYQSRIQELEQDKVRLTEELKSAQVRSGKLIKKIKSLKTDYDLLVDKNLKLNQEAKIVLNDETKIKVDLLEKEVGRLQSELQKRGRQMEEASTQADDDQLTWLSNEYESVKLEIQHLIEEIHFKDANLVEVMVELQSKREKWDGLLEEIAKLREIIGTRENEVAHLEELLRQHIDTCDSRVSDEQQPHDMSYLLQQKEEEVSHLEELLRQHLDRQHESDPPDRQLDESLYMLHQKEVRCDELTLELMQLLEERDTLQLRLSTTIRQYEELRASCAHVDNMCSSTPCTTPNNSPVLSNKLLEVRSMGREQRSMALQQRADATVSRDNQSQSETLINWIRGRTTPKVLHI